MTKEEKKAEKYRKLLEEVGQFMADHYYKNYHTLWEEDVVKHFSYAKPKHVKRAFEELQ